MLQLKNLFGSKQNHLLQKDFLLPKFESHEILPSQVLYSSLSELFTNTITELHTHKFLKQEVNNLYIALKLLYAQTVNEELNRTEYNIDSELFSEYEIKRQQLRTLTKRYTHTLEEYNSKQAELQQELQRINELTNENLRLASLSKLNEIAKQHLLHDHLDLENEIEQKNLKKFNFFNRFMNCFSLNQFNEANSRIKQLLIDKSQLDSEDKMQVMETVSNLLSRKKGFLQHELEKLNATHPNLNDDELKHDLNSIQAKIEYRKKRYYNGISNNLAMYIMRVYGFYEILLQKISLNSLDSNNTLPQVKSLKGIFLEYKNSLLILLRPLWCPQLKDEKLLKVYSQLTIAQKQELLNNSEPKQERVLTYQSNPKISI